MCECSLGLAWGLLDRHCQQAKAWGLFLLKKLEATGNSFPQKFVRICQVSSRDFSRFLEVTGLSLSPLYPTNLNMNQGKVMGVKG